MVNSATGEIIEEYDRDSRLVTKIARDAEKRERYLELRKIDRLANVRNLKDLQVLYQGHYQGSGTVQDQGNELLHSPTCQLSGKAKSLLVQIISKQLVAKNHAVVSIENLKELIDDKSGNYNRYLSELESNGFIRVKRLNKSDRLISVNPVYGFCGTGELASAARLRAIKAWYLPRSRKLVLVNFDENDALEAA